MILWIAIVIATLVAIALVVEPLLRKRGRSVTRAEAEIAIYRDQLRELDNEAERGTIGATEADAARVEVQRRLLHAASDDRDSTPARRRRPLIAGILALAFAAMVLALYGYLGSPSLRDRPFAQRQAEIDTARMTAGDIESRIAQLEKRLDTDPDDIESWWLLGQSHAYTGRYAEAAEAYRRALAVSDNDPRFLAAYAEMLTMANGNLVVPAARDAFAQVLQLLPDDPRARYYLGMAAAQDEDYQTALDAWLELYRDSPDDAPWRESLRRGIAEMASLLDRDVTELLPDLSQSEVSGMASAEGTTGPAGDAESMRARVEANPNDYESWLLLARAEAVRGNVEAAREAIGSVRDLYPNAPFVRQQIDEVESELGLSSAERRGPTDEDMRAASEMTADEQLAMIDSMVGGLAERLNADPDDLEGWLMLIRSYRVLGRTGDAREAYRSAQAHYADDPDATAQLEALAGRSGLLD